MGGWSERVMGQKGFFDQFVLGRERDDQLTMSDRQRARRHDQAAIRLACKCRDGALNVAGVAHVDRAHFHPERRRTA